MSWREIIRNATISVAAVLTLGQIGKWAYHKGQGDQKLALKEERIERTIAVKTDDDARILDEATQTLSRDLREWNTGNQTWQEETSKFNITLAGEVLKDVQEKKIKKTPWLRVAMNGYIADLYKLEKQLRAEKTPASLARATQVKAAADGLFTWLVKSL